MRAHSVAAASDPLAGCLRRVNPVRAQRALDTATPRPLHCRPGALTRSHVPCRAPSLGRVHAGLPDEPRTEPIAPQPTTRRVPSATPRTNDDRVGSPASFEPHAGPWLSLTGGAQTVLHGLQSRFRQAREVSDRFGRSPGSRSIRAGGHGRRRKAPDDQRFSGNADGAAGRVPAEASCPEERGPANPRRLAL